LIFFDARQHPHYARRLIIPAMRIVAVMKFHAGSCLESSRRELDQHRYGDDV